MHISTCEQPTTLPCHKLQQPYIVSLGTPLSTTTERITVLDTERVYDLCHCRLGCGPSLDYKAWSGSQNILVCGNSLTRFHPPTHPPTRFLTAIQFKQSQTRQRQRPRNQARHSRSEVICTKCIPSFMKVKVRVIPCTVNRNTSNIDIG